MHYLWPVFAVLFVFGLVVCFHELGHFLFAKWSGIGVEIFSFGMGPRAFGVKIGETDYRFSWLPLGGYVKMQGDEETEGGAVGAAAQGANDRPDAARPQRDPRRDYDKHPKYQKLAVMAAGAFFNIIMAAALWSALNYGDRPALLTGDAPPLVTRVIPDSPAARAGIQRLDLITSVNGRAIPDASAALFEIGTSTKGIVLIKVLRGKQVLSLSVTPELIRASGEKVARVGILLPYAMAAPPAGSPAAAAGLRRMDLLIAVEGIGGDSLYDALHLFAENAARRALALEVWRDGALVPLALTRARGDEDWGLSAVEVRHHGALAALRAGFAEIRDKSGLLYRFLGKMFSGQTSARSLSGPVGIIRMLGGAEVGNFEMLFQLAAFISLQLGIMNLLPIPALDGGHILILLLEGLLRRDFTMKTKERIIAAGFYTLLALLAVLIVSDVLKIFN